MSILDGIAALYTGDYEATRRYCGDYWLVIRWSDKRQFRCRKGSIPHGFERGIRVGIYDSDGYLKSEHWSLPRVEDSQLG